MKICHIIFSLKTGGAEVMLVDIVNKQIEDAEIFMIIVNDIIDSQVMGKIDERVKIIMIKRNPLSKNIFPLIKLNYILYKKKPTIIHFHNVKGINLILPYFRKKSILTIHDTRISTSNFSKYKKLFAISKAVQTDVYQKYGLDSKIVNNGISIEKIKCKNSISNLSPFKIVQIGRLDPKKGQYLLIEAIQKLVNQFKITDLYVDFIGTDIASEALLKKMVKDYKLENYINFLGEQDRDFVYNNLYKYDLLIHPSTYEGFGLTVAEAMAAKVPVLVSNIEGPMEIIQEGKYGYYFKTEDYDDLAIQLKDIIENYDERRKISEKAYQHCINNYTINLTAKEYIKNYYSI